MKINSRGTEVEVFGAETDEHVFQISTSSVAFETLSAKLYSDRITAIIRELSCNAYDAHVEVGKKAKPFEVDLPSALSPEFRIRDFGPGMTDSQVLELYCTYFASSKQHTNKQIGGFGIGSKSPFSYTSGFSVTAYQAGEKRTYAAYINEQRVPAVVRLSTEPTEEPDGLEVKFPVKSADFSEFRNKASAVFEFFDPVPKVNIPDFEVVRTEYQLEGKGWKLRRLTGGGIRIIQGLVPYAVRGLDLKESPMLSVDLDIFVPVGTLAPSASRETLTNEAATVDKLHQILERVGEEVVAGLSSELDSLESGHDKLCYLAKYKQSPAMNKIAKLLADKLIEDEDLFGRKVINPRDFPNITATQYTRKWGQTTTGTIVGKYSVSFSLDLDRTFSGVEFIIVDAPRGGKSKVERYLETKVAGEMGGRGVIAIFPSEVNSKDFDLARHVANAMELIAAFGNPKFRKLSEIVLPKRDPTLEPTRSTRKVKHWVGRPSFDTSLQRLWAEYGDAYPDDGGEYYYLRTHWNRPIIFEEDHLPEFIGKVIDRMVWFLGIPRENVFAIGAAERVLRSRASTTWIDLVDRFENEAALFLLNNPVTVYGSTQNLDTLHLPDVQVPLIVEAREILTKIVLPAKYSAIKEILNQVNFPNLTKVWNGEVTKDYTRAPQVYAEIVEAWPLLAKPRTNELAGYYVAREVESKQGEEDGEDSSIAGECGKVGGGAEDAHNGDVSGRDDVQPGKHVADLEEVSTGAQGEERAPGEEVRECGGDGVAVVGGSPEGGAEQCPLPRWGCQSEAACEDTVAG